MRQLDAGEFKIKNILLKYVVDGSGLMDQFLQQVGGSGKELFKFQKDLVGCIDFKINYNSINILSHTCCSSSKE